MCFWTPLLNRWDSYHGLDLPVQGYRKWTFVTRDLYGIHGSSHFTTLWICWTGLFDNRAENAGGCTTPSSHTLVHSPSSLLCAGVYSAIRTLGLWIKGCIKRNIPKPAPNQTQQLQCVNHTAPAADSFPGWIQRASFDFESPFQFGSRVFEGPSSSM